MIQQMQWAWNVIGRSGIAAGLLDETEVSGPVIDLAFQLYGEARAALGDGADYLEAIKVIEEQAGVEIRG